MGVLIDGLDGHEGYADRRLPDGRLAGGVWTQQTSGFVAYVAACGCGWTSQHGWPATQRGEQAALADWHQDHADPLLARQATRRHLELARLLEWLGDQAGRLHDPATVARVRAGLDHAWDLVADVQRDLDRQAPQREADLGR
jgi:hypothetical protein